VLSRSQPSLRSVADSTPAAEPCGRATPPPVDTPAIRLVHEVTTAAAGAATLPPVDTPAIRGHRDHGAMDRGTWLRTGRALRALRIRRDLGQADLARRVGVSRTTISRIERGQLASMTLRRLSDVAAALGASLHVSVRWNGEALDRLLDEGHARLVAAVVGYLNELGWETAVEVSFAVGPERGSIDVLGYHRATAALLVGEVKSVVPDAGGTVYGLDRKARVAPVVARERGLPVRTVSRLLVVGDTRTARRRIARFAALWAAAFPVRGRQLAAWLRDPGERSISGLLLLGTGAPAAIATRSRVARRRTGRAVVANARTVTQTSRPDGHDASGAGGPGTSNRLGSSGRATAVPRAPGAGEFDDAAPRRGSD
jgi:transcriptional regulator with XRE-family HTH domain